MSERREALTVVVVGAVALGLLVFVLSGAWRVLSPGLTSAPRAATVTRADSGRVPMARPGAAQQAADLTRFLVPAPTHVPARWEAGFYPIYDTASSTFGLNWLLLASIHKQETAFSTAPSTYHGRNRAGCCAGPMQFNLTNGPVSSWRLMRGGYRLAARPAHYDHATARHPSIYDDFDAVMAAARLLRADGAGRALDADAWRAAYDYYGHDATGVTYADQVLGRAIGWSQRGFCINCALDDGIVAGVHAAYGAPVLSALMAQRPRPPRRGRRRPTRSPSRR